MSEVALKVLRDSYRCLSNLLNRWGGYFRVGAVMTPGIHYVLCFNKIRTT